MMSTYMLEIFYQKHGFQAPISQKCESNCDSDIDHEVDDICNEFVSLAESDSNKMYNTLLGKLLERRDQIF